jgi:hypothetical protein
MVISLHDFMHMSQISTFSQRILLGETRIFVHCRPGKTISATSSETTIEFMIQE